MRKSGHFEQSLVELETIVLQLEKGELSLDDALREFEKGMALAHTCQDTLRKAEQKIELLSSKNTMQDESLDD